jgi:mono/diheme cytochrome c family protein
MRRLPALVAVTVALASPTVGRAYQPRVNYQLQCMGCHHADGAGEEGRVPSVRRTLVPFSALAEGRDFVMRVPGVAQAPLSDAEIAALLNWMARNLSDVPLPESFVDYTADEVGRARHRPLASVRAARGLLLGRVAE